MSAIVTLLVLHYTADFGLQPDGIVSLKRESVLILIGHAFLCGFLPYLFGLPLHMCAALAVAHFTVDFSKIRTWIDLETDQLIHVASVVIVGIAWNFAV